MDVSAGGGAVSNHRKRKEPCCYLNVYFLTLTVICYLKYVQNISEYLFHDISSKHNENILHCIFNMYFLVIFFQGSEDLLIISS